MANIAALPGPVLTKSKSIPRAAPPLSAASHYAIRRQALGAAWCTRAVAASNATAKLIASGRAYDSPWELLRMQQAIVKQLHQMGQDWLVGLAAWTQECTEIKAANTMSKMVEQEFDLIGQFGQLMSDQVTALTALMEGVQVGYGFWVQEKLET